MKTKWKKNSKRWILENNSGNEIADAIMNEDGFFEIDILYSLTVGDIEDMAAKFTELAELLNRENDTS
jgi:Zn-dependent membrane protease YugP